MKLIVIDGGDGCGKANSSQKLYEFQKENYNVHLISFLITNLIIQYLLNHI